VPRHEQTDQDIHSGSVAGCPRRAHQGHHADNNIHGARAHLRQRFCAGAGVVGEGAAYDRAIDGHHGRNQLKEMTVSFGGAARILVVGSDSVERYRLVDYLMNHHMSAVPARGRNDVMRQFTSLVPTLVILDLAIDGSEGLDLLCEIRSRCDIPVIITAARPCDEIDPALVLERGADDYLKRPFGLRELLARVRAILRRRPTSSASAWPTKRGSCTFGGWLLDRHIRRLTNPRGDQVVLTRREYATLLAFLCAPQRPLSREHLLRATRPREDILDRSIDVQVLRLRRKLESNPEFPRTIMTERGVGYLFALPVQEL